MSLLTIAWRSLTQRALASSLTGLSMALGVALVVAVLIIHNVVSESFQRNSGLGYNVIVGAKGGRLELVLNTVYHLGTPVENIPYSFLKELREGAYKPYVASAIPYCLGDNYQGHRVVATVPELFATSEYLPGRRYAFREGRNFESDHFFEAVAGSIAASEAGLKVGDTFQPAHGVLNDGLGHKHDAFKVVGILEPTGTPNDRALFINIEGFYLLENHAKPVDSQAGTATTKPPAPSEHKSHDHPAHDDKHAHEEHDHKHDHDHDHDHDHKHDHEERSPLPEAQRELTAILVRTSTPAAAMRLPNLINEGNVAQAVLPIREIRMLFDVIVGPIELLLLVLTGLIVVVASVGIMVSITSSMNERRREIAVMRALGARRNTVRAIVLLESILLSITGGLVGWILGRLLLVVLSPAITARTGVAIGLARLVPAELALIPAILLLAIVAGYLPAMTAYRSDVGKALVQAQ